MPDHIPLVDFIAYGLGRDGDAVVATDLENLATKIHGAFSNIGFVYLKNHGIPEELISLINADVDTFFSLPVQVKSKYARTGDSNHGWVKLEKESLNPERPGDLKESFNVTPTSAEIWPTEEVPSFKEDMMKLFSMCTELSNRILDVTAIGLGLSDKDFFRKCHNIATDANLTTMRMLCYPPLNQHKLKPGQVRCGEHSDYGSLTLLFQDDAGGLEVKTRSGTYIPATPIPGTVIVNIGDLMQRWTADKLVSTKHRVLIPDSTLQISTARKSLAFFVQPDNDAVITCLDGSNKYEPVSSLDYLKRRYQVTY